MRPKTSIPYSNKFSRTNLMSEATDLESGTTSNPFNPIKAYMSSPETQKSQEQVQSILSRPISYFDGYQYQKEDLTYKNMLRNNYTLGLRDDKDFNQFMINMLQTKDFSDQIVKDMRKKIIQNEKDIKQAKNAGQKEVNKLLVPNRVDHLVMEAVNMTDQENLKQLICASGIKSMAFKVKNKRSQIHLKETMEEIKELRKADSGIIKYMVNPNKNPDIVNNVRMVFEPAQYQKPKRKIEDVDYQNFNFELNLFESSQQVEEFQEQRKAIELQQLQFQKKMNNLINDSEHTHHRKQSLLGFSRPQIDYSKLSTPYASQQNSAHNSNMQSQREIVSHLKEVNEKQKVEKIIKNVENLLLQERQQNTGVMDQEEIQFFLTDSRAFEEHPRNIQRFQNNQSSQSQIYIKQNSISGENSVSRERKNRIQSFEENVKPSALGNQLTRNTSLNQMQSLLNNIKKNEKQSQGFRVVAQQIDKEITQMERRIQDLEMTHIEKMQAKARRNLFKKRK